MIGPFLNNLTHLSTHSMKLRGVSVELLKLDVFFPWIDGFGRSAQKSVKIPLTENFGPRKFDRFSLFYILHNVSHH